MHSLRTFIAVEVAADVRAAAVRLIKKLAPLSPDVKWVEPQHLHITLNFLGDVELLEVPKLCQLVTDAVAALPPFDMQLMGAGAFPANDRPRTIWLGVGEGADELGVIHERLSDRLAELGFRAEQRQFKPHLTLGRAKGQQIRGLDELTTALDEHRGYPGGATDVNEVVIFSSELERRGPHYEVLGVAPLDGA